MLLSLFYIGYANFCLHASYTSESKIKYKFLNRIPKIEATQIKLSENK